MTPRTIKLAFATLAVVAILVVGFALFRSADAASISQNLFNLGGTGNGQIVPGSQAWNINTPLKSPTGLAMASSTGGSLSNAASFWFKVVATNGTGTTTASSELATTTNTANSRINITWTAVPGATQYFVFFSTTTPGNENAYFSATTTNAYTFTSTSTPTFGTVPGFPSSFASQLNTSAPYASFGGRSFQMLSTTSPALGGSALTIGTCSTVTSTFANTSFGSTTSVIATPQKDPGASFWWKAVVMSATSIQTQICSTNSATPVSTPYNLVIF